MRLGTKRLLLLLALALLSLPTAAAARAKQYVSGGFVQAAACVPTGFQPTADPNVWGFECDAGTTTWDGDLQGQTVITNVHGTVDLRDGITNSITSGTANETIYVVTERGLRGTLEMFSTFVVTGPDFVATNEVLSGTGDFAGATGTLTFEGAAVGTGTYEGWIKTPSRKSSRRRGRR